MHSNCCVCMLLEYIFDKEWSCEVRRFWNCKSFTQVRYMITNFVTRATCMSRDCTAFQLSPVSCVLFICLLFYSLLNYTIPGFVNIVNLEDRWMSPVESGLFTTVLQPSFPQHCGVSTHSHWHSLLPLSRNL